MLEMTADRLVLVDQGTAREFDGTLDDYVALILAGPDGAAAPAADAKANRKDARRAAAEARDRAKALRADIRALEAELARLTAERSAIDRAMFDPPTAAQSRPGARCQATATWWRPLPSSVSTTRSR